MLKDAEMAGIYDTTRGRCGTGMLLSGQFIQCDLAYDHEGWAHQSVEAKAMWR